MDVLFFTSGIIQVIMVFFLVYLSMLCRKKSQKLLANYFLGLAVFVIITAVMYLVWAFEAALASYSDYLIISSAFIAAKTALIAGIISMMTKHKRIPFLLVFYLLAVVAAQYSVIGFFLAVGLISFLLMLVLFFSFEGGKSNLLKKAEWYGIACAALALIIYVAAIVGYANWLFLGALPELLLLFVLYYWIAYMRKERPAGKTRKKPSSFVSFILRLILFIPTITIFLIVSTIAVHEVGHALAGEFYGCETSRAVIYDMGFGPHTEIACADKNNAMIVGLAGTMLPLLVAFLLFLSRQGYAVTMASFIAGFSLLYLYGDFAILGISKNYVLIAAFFGMVLLITGISRTCVHFSEELRDG